MVFLVLFIFGLVIGSFINVLIYRLPREEGWWSGRSYCPKCKHDLQARDLVPLLSWLWLRGKCRYCHKPIHWRYPVIESLHALLWCGVGLMAVHGMVLGGVGQLGLGGVDLMRTLVMLGLVSMLLVIMVVDLEHYIIPDEMVIGMGLVGVLLAGVDVYETSNWLMIQERVWAGLGAGLFFLALFWLTKGKGMGFGDVKFSLVEGLIMGFLVVVSLVSAFFIGAAVGIVLLLMRKKGFGQPIPFGPFLIVGMVIGMLWGQGLTDWYLLGLL